MPTREMNNGNTVWGLIVRVVQAMTTRKSAERVREAGMSSRFTVYTHSYPQQLLYSTLSMFKDVRVERYIYIVSVK